MSSKTKWVKLPKIYTTSSISICSLANKFISLIIVPNSFVFKILLNISIKIFSLSILYR